MADQQDLKRMIDEFVDDFNRHDLDKLVDCYADDCVRVDPLTGKLTGKDAIRGFYTTLFQGFPDCKLRADNVLASADTVAVEWTFTGTNTGKFPPFENWTPTGKSVELDGASFYNLRDGKIAVERVHTDYGSMLDELGIRAIAQKAA